MKAHEFLKQGIAEMEDRARTYDKPGGERSMPKVVAAFNAITDHVLTEEQGWLFMGILKMVRSQQGAYRADNYVDEAAYASLRGEAAYTAYTIKATLEGIKDAEAGNLTTADVVRARFERKAKEDYEVSSTYLNVTKDQFDESRMDIIGQNGNGAEHYEALMVHEMIPPDTGKIMLIKPKWLGAPEWATHLLASGKDVTSWLWARKVGNLYYSAKDTKKEYPILMGPDYWSVFEPRPL